MDVNEFGGLIIKGFKAAGISAGIKKNGKKDFALIVSEAPCAIAGVFTKNSVKAAPVIIDMERVKKGSSPRRCDKQRKRQRLHGQEGV